MTHQHYARLYFYFLRDKNARACLLFSERKEKTLGEVFWAGCCVATPPRERARESLRAAPTLPFSLMSCCHGEGCSGEVGVSWRQRGRHPGRCCSAGVCHMFSPQIFTTFSGGSRVLPWFLQPPSASATTSVVRVNLTPFPTCENRKLRDYFFSVKTISMSICSHFTGTSSALRISGTQHSGLTVC